MFDGVRPTGDELATTRAGDELLPLPAVVMDRAFTVDAPPATVWPWIEQLGKRRAGWYLPRSVERFIPPGRRAIRRIDPRWLGLGTGDVIPDYGGRDETFEVAAIDQPHTLVYRSRRGRTDVTWSITLTEVAAATRISLRLRLAPVRHRWLANTAGEFVDALTVAGLAGGLRERVARLSAD